MDKKVIKKFAIESRIKLRDGVINKLAKLGITDKGIEEVVKIGNDTIEIPSNGERFVGKDVEKRVKLVKVLKEHEDQVDSREKNRESIAFDNFVEEVAYTWFNRLIAIRFMEVNNYLPGKLRVLSSETGVREPDIITNLLSSDLYSEMDINTQNRVVELMSDNSADAVDELYQLVFIKQCNSLSRQLPDLFEHIDDYTELLFTISYIDNNGVIANLLNIPESDFDIQKEGQVEIIGWMYQYYNTEPKDKVFSRGRRKIRADEIPAATQLFTPDWIVRYMVENSLGRYYIDMKLSNPTETRTEKEIAESFGWRYYLPTAEQPEDVQLKILDDRKNKSDIVLQELKLLDNAMGSGHILVYAFDVFMQLYVAEGFRERDAALYIIENNIYGLEIDKRAYQLAYFAIMMKGREYNRRILNKDVKSHLYRFIDSANIPTEYFERLEELSTLNNTETAKNLSELKSLFNEFKYATELGSVIKISNINFERVNELKKFINVFNEFSNMDILYQIPEAHEKVTLILSIVELLTSKYTAIVTNPPYLNKMSSTLDKYVKQNYPDVKTDLFSVFIKMNSQMLVKDGYAGFMTPFVWMFIKSYEALRTFLITSKSISSLIQFEYSAFEEATVPICCFTIKNSTSEPVGSYFKLSDFRGGMSVQNEKVLEAIKNPNVEYFYNTSQQNFEKIPGIPISFWVSENTIRLFQKETIADYGFAGIGMRTGDNERFLRRWFEVSSINFNSNLTDIDNQENCDKWLPYNKGGEFKRFYGNNEYVVNWQNNGYEIKKATREKYPQLGKNLGWKISNEHYYLKSGITWTGVSTGKFNARKYPIGFLFDSGANGLFCYDKSKENYILGLLNTKTTNWLLQLINPTINYGAGTIRKIPVIYKPEIKPRVDYLVNSLYINTIVDWDSSEISWNFKLHPLV
ncbi:BREX-1 system adenine-specific DNA-methyltransferase PglX [Ligilactobacillus faecis]|uniref:BREX-1 system adenine-specific DNA-methyltransferase PglX n=1 Tax=Ligilactobacillus faecis TaxID=762833 RepID=UPI0024696AA3|nr:BREX-1 system adenine-specific DNA-methyltransferase PglX [Ligilactobacillus faecis]WGN88966.1 BREX-1 system adenine-specific DNA-methyltransferase PglX [Ligilactobacillus faecis]